MQSCIIKSILVIAIALPALHISAQTLIDTRTDLRDDKRVKDVNRPLDQNVEDIGVLSTSLRLLEPGLYTPTGFMKVYPVPGHPGLLMRVDGALHAVFPTSVYTANGPVVPANTIFYIGKPRILPQSHFASLEQEVKQPTAFLSENQIDNRVSSETPGADTFHGNNTTTYRPVNTNSTLVSTEINRAVYGPSIITSVYYRKQRLIELLSKAGKDAEAISRQTSNNSESKRD